MKRLLNTLYVTTEDAYVTLDGDNIVVREQKQELGRFPLHILESICLYTYAGASPALIGACAERGIGLCFYTPSGKYLGRVVGENNGNVLLRREQYRVADSEAKSICISRNMIYGKLFNCRWTIERTIRDYPLRVNVDQLSDVSEHIREITQNVRSIESANSLRGIEGEAAEAYFSAFNHMILNQKEDFKFTGRNRRPPLDPINAALSYTYSLLKNMCSSALSSVGLDSYVGFMHTDRSGRESLALDLMEELRAPLCDRFVISMINQKRISIHDFQKCEDGAVLLNAKGRKTMIKCWQERGKEEIIHPFIDEKVPWHMVPSVQSLLLARHLRGDIDEYPCFLWK